VCRLTSFHVPIMCQVFTGKSPLVFNVKNTNTNTKLGSGHILPWTWIPTRTTKSNRYPAEARSGSAALCTPIKGYSFNYIHCLMCSSLQNLQMNGTIHSCSMACIFVFICVYFVRFCFKLHSCCITVSVVGWTWLVINSLDLSSFSALTLLVGSFGPQTPVPDMIYHDVRPCLINQSNNGLPDVLIVM